MRRLWFLGCLAAVSACSNKPNDLALKVVLDVAAGQKATCVVLEISGESQVLLTQELKRTKDSYTIAMRRGELPVDVSIRARGFISADGCKTPRVTSGDGPAVTAKFPASGVDTVTVKLPLPDAMSDADQDGFVATAQGGSDCDDHDAAVNPKATQLCTGTVDQDCNGLAGCSDPVCTSQPVCQRPPDRLAFVTAAQTVITGVCSGVVTVESQDAAGPVTAAAAIALTLDANPATGVGFFSDPTCATPATATAIGAGQTQATFFFRAAAAGTFTLSASAAGLASANQLETITPAPVTAIAFSTPARTSAVSACSQVLTIELRDANAQPTIAAAATTVSVSAAPATGLSLFTDAACSTPLAGNALLIATGSSSGSFFAKSTRAGTTLLTATSGALPATTQTLTVTAGSPTQLKLTSSPQGIAVATCSGAVTVEAQDSLGNASPVAAGATVVLTSSGLSGFTFYSDAACANPVTGVPIAANASSVIFYFEGTTAGSASITATASGLGMDTQLAVIGAGPAAKLAITSAAQIATAGVCSGQVTVQARDTNDNPSNVSGTALQVTLAAAAPLQFFSDAACATAVTAVPIAVGSSSAGFFFKSTLAGSPQLTVSSTLPTGDQQIETVKAAAATSIHFTNSALSTGAGVCSAQLTIEARDPFNNPSTVAAVTAVNLSSVAAGVSFFGASGCGGSASAAQNILAGASQVSFYARANTAAAYQLTAQATGLGTDSQAFTVTAGAVARVHFTTPARTVVAGVCSAVLTAQRQDALGNPVSVSATLAVGLASTATSGLTFHSDAACGSAPITGVTIAANATSADFYVRATKVEAVDLTLTSSGLTGDLQALTVGPAAASKLVFTTPQRVAASNACSQVVTVAQQDAFGNAATITTSLLITLTDDGTGFDFHVAPGCGDAQTGQVTLNPNASSVSFYFQGSTAGTVTMTASATGRTAGTQTATVQTGSAAKLAILTPQRSVSAGACSLAITIQRQDAAGNPVTTGGAQAVDLSSTAAAGLVFHTDATCLSAGVVQATIPSSSSSVDVFVTTTKVETVDLTAGALGFTSATQPFTTTAGAATQLVITTPAQLAVAINGCSAIVTVQQQDAFGNPVTAGAALPLTLSSNGTGFGFHLVAGCGDTATTAASIGIGASSASFYFQGSTLGAVTITVSATGRTPATQGEAIVAGPATKLVFLTAARTISAGGCSQVLTVEREDASSTPVTIATPLTVDLSSTAVSGLTFYKDAACATSPVTQVTINGSASTTDFYVSANLVGAVTITAASAPLTSATQGFTTNLGAPSKLAFTSPPQTIPALGCSALTTVTLQDAGGNAVNALAPVIVTFSGISSGVQTVTFFTNNTCTTPLALNQRTIATGTQTTTVYFKVDNAGTETLSAAATGLTTGTQAEKIDAATPTKLSFTTAPPTVEAGFCQAVTVEREDVLSRPTAPVTATTVTMTSAPASGILFFTDAGCSTALGATFDILANATSATVYVKGVSGSLAGTIPGNQVYTLTDTATGLTSDTLAVTVRPMVRRRSAACTLTTNTVNCPITPTLPDITRTILFAQATPGNGDQTADDDNVVCYLDANAGAAQVTCSRQGTGGNVNIEWQTVSFPYSYANGGVSVQQIGGGCFATTANAMPINTAITAVPLAETFVLLNHGSIGADNDGEDFFTGQLTSTTNYRVSQSDASTTCTQTMGFSAQVVSWAGASVNRGLLTGGSGATFTASQSTTSLTSAFLLYSSRQTGDLGGNNNICRRRLRGEITNATTLTFTRGCTGADVQDISWELVQLPAGASVQQVQGTILNGGTTVNVAVTSVDLTRSFAFIGGMGQGGTASGSTDYAANDRVGMALARAVMNSATQLVLTRTASQNPSTSIWTAFVVQLTP